MLNLLQDAQNIARKWKRKHYMKNSFPPSSSPLASQAPNFSKSWLSPWIFNNYSPKAKWITASIPRDEVEGNIRRDSLSLSPTITTITMVMMTITTMMMMSPIGMGALIWIGVFVNIKTFEGGAYSKESVWWKESAKSNHLTFLLLL